MKTAMFTCVLLALPLAVVADSVETPIDDPLVVEARQHTMTFAEGLKSTLMAGMKADGPGAAIHLCNIQAPEIAMINSNGGWDVGRTSLKIRNPNNAPDAWETSVLEAFEQQVAAGADIATLEASTRQDGQFRYMKAIPVGGPCVVCHGESLAAPVKAKLDELYPEDHARGYLPGQLRGAFTLTFSEEKE
jgi:hypothetical protein